MDQDMKEMFQLVITELDSLKKGQNEFRQDLTEFRQDLTELRQDFRESEQRRVLFESTISEQVGALFDGYKQNLEANYELKQKIDKIG